MSITTKILRLATFVAAAATLGTTTARAQGTNPGQVVQAVAKLNQVQLAFAKRLANDAAFASQLDAAIGSGNFGGAAALVASATGLSTNEIRIGRRGSTLGANVPSEQTSGLARTASYLRAPRASNAMITSATLCFNLGVVSGCIIW